MVLDKVEFAGSNAYGPAAWAERVLDALPRDIVICDWQYISTADTARHFAGKGFDVIACDCTYGPVQREFPFDFSAAWHASRLYAAARRAGAIGALQTNWGDADGNPVISKWFFSVNSLSMAWQPAQRVRLRRMARSWARLEMGVDGDEYEDFLARLSVSLFGGTGRRSVTNEETADKHIFRHARAWWDAAGARLIAREKAVIDGLAGRLALLRAAAKRGRDLLDLLDVPLVVKRLTLNQVENVGRAARLYRRALALQAGDPRRAALLSAAALKMEAYAAAFDGVLAAMRRVADDQGVDESVFQRARGRQEEVRARAARLRGDPPPPFGEIFWAEPETPYER
jgi:hypothetical protein